MFYQVMLCSTIHIMMYISAQKASEVTLVKSHLAACTVHYVDNVLPLTTTIVFNSFD